MTEDPAEDATTQARDARSEDGDLDASRLQHRGEVVRRGLRTTDAMREVCLIGSEQDPHRAHLRCDHAERTGRDESAIVSVSRRSLATTVFSVDAAGRAIVRVVQKSSSTV